MESIVVALLMLVNNEIKEARIQPNLASCLSGRRQANRDVSNNVEYRCIKTKAEVHTNKDGSKYIKKIILK